MSMLKRPAAECYASTTTGMRFTCRGHYAKRSDLTAYGTSKLMTIMAHTEMTHRLKGTGLESFICQPGMTSTPVYQKTDKSQVLANVLNAAQKVMGQTEDRGAIPLMYSATAPELAGMHVWACNTLCRLGQLHIQQTCSQKSFPQGISLWLCCNTHLVQHVNLAACPQYI